MPCSFDVISLNIRGIGDSNKRCKIFNYMKKNASSSGVIFLQETHSCASKESIWTNQRGCGKNAIIFSHGASNARGLKIAFREPLEYKILTSKCDNNGRHIIFNIQIQGSPFIIINYYAPDKENDQLLVLNEINQTIDELNVEQNTQIIWGGDFKNKVLIYSMIQMEETSSLRLSQSQKLCP